MAQEINSNREEECR